jgi:hypothetical protein
MTPEEYRQTEWPAPYILRLRRADANLYYFGEEHSHDPANPQWDKAKSLWKEFLADSSQKKVALVEGGVRKAGATEEASIRSDGGMGLVCFLAKTAGIDAASPEPDGSEEYRMLEKEFSRDQIQYYYFARMAYQWMQMGEPKQGFNEYISNSLKWEEHVSGWKDFDFSLDHMKAIHASLFGKPFSLDDSKTLYDAINPMSESVGPINQVSRTTSRLRDEHIAAAIVRYLEQGCSVYAQFGFSHVVVQEPWLRERLQTSIPKDLLPNINCHKWVLFQLGKISWDELVSDPHEQRARDSSFDFTYGDKALAISGKEFVPVKDASSLLRLANESCEIRQTCVGQIKDSETGEMAHSFIAHRKQDGTYECVEKQGFKDYPFKRHDLVSLLDFVNDKGERSYQNQLWRFIPIK